VKAAKKKEKDEKKEAERLRKVRMKATPRWFGFLSRRNMLFAAHLYMDAASRVSRKKDKLAASCLISSWR
jgi:hypothetical protein